MHKNADSVPQDLSTIFDAELTYNNILDDSSTSTAVMCDVDPTTSLFSQVFATVLTLHQDGKNILRGVPSKASARNINPFKILNRPDAKAVTNASANFMFAMAIEDLEGGENSPIIQLFKAYGSQTKKLIGLNLRFTVMEITEDQDPDYQQLGTVTNPAKITYAGNISPMYEGDLKSTIAGRYLANIGQKPALPVDNPKLPFSPLECQLDESGTIVSYDLLNVLPEQPIPGTEALETYPLGTLIFEADYELNGIKTTRTLKQIDINEQDFSREYVLQSGGILDCKVQFDNNFTTEDLKKSTLAISLIPPGGSKIRILQEIPVMVYSDQVGVYAEQNADPCKGYRVYGEALEPVVLRIMDKGVPAALPVYLESMQFTVSSGALGYNSQPFLKGYYSDGDHVYFPTHIAENAIYYFYPQGIYSKQPNVGNILDLGSFFNIRILPAGNYDKYLNPYHAEFPTKVTFEFLYQEIFQTYETIYPAMNLVLPFTKENWDNPTMAAMMVERVDPKNWANGTYMPRTRDMSEAQRQLILCWAEQFKSAEFGLFSAKKEPLHSGEVSPVDHYIKR